MEHIPAGHTASRELVNKYKPAKLVMLQKFDEGVQRYSGEMAADAIQKWASAHALPLVIEFTKETQPSIFSETAPTKHLLALHAAGFSGKQQVVESMKLAAAAHRGDVLCITVEANSDNSGVFNFFGVKAEEVKTGAKLVGIDQAGSSMKKSFFSGAVEPARLSTWMGDWLAGKVQPTLKSANPPAEEDNQEPVRVVVGSTFRREVLRSKKDTMVQFHAPWCGHCKSFAHQYDKLAASMGKKIPSLKFVKIDATENEIDEVEVKGFPTFYFFKASEPSKPLLYEGTRSMEAMEDFILENMPATQEGGAHRDGEL
eukprot:TRINITY_DN17771_c0_g1_i1.p1 TRINITY_DN17771_c0_g1~~TRINITY_DN17771_c0_g1_i1.p1  ORF type:complete len:314 (+),score=111.16 TRINITY_DN17771_c0_g1_i1:662-1603(+)